MKKNTLVISFLILSSIALVSASNLGYNLEMGMDQLIELIERLFTPVSAFLFGSTEYMFERVLFLIIIISLVYIALGQIPIFEDENGKVKTTRKIITAAVSLLSVRYMAETEWIKSIMLPYTVLGVALTAFLPLIIYFFFVTKGMEHSSPTLRKTMWIFFIVIFMGVWASRYGELGELSWIYFFTAVAALIFFFADGTIQKKFAEHERALANADDKADYIAKLKLKLQELREHENLYSPSEFKRLEKKRKARIAKAIKSKF